MKNIGVYILLDMAAASFRESVQAVWQAIADSFLGVLRTVEGVRVSVIGYGDTPSVHLDGVKPGTALAWTPPRETPGLSNLNLALFQCLVLLKRAPPGETPLILLSSDGLVTDRPDLIARRWERMTEGARKYALLRGRPCPGVPFPAFGASANAIYRLCGEELDRLSSDMQEDLAFLSIPRLPELPAPEQNDEIQIIKPQTMTNMNITPNMPQMPYAVQGSADMSIQSMLRSLNVYDDQIARALSADSPFISRIFPTVQEKLMRQYKAEIMEVGLKKNVKAHALLGDFQLKIFSEWGNYQLTQMKAHFRSETALKIMDIYQKIIVPFSETRNTLLRRLEQDYKRCEEVTVPYLRQQFEQSLNDTTAQIFALYHRLGEYLAGILDSGIQAPSPLNP